MRNFVRLCVSTSVLSAAAHSLLACDRMPAGQQLWVRLLAPVSTYSARAGDPVHAVLTRPLVCEGDTLLPSGTPVDGVVRSRRKVGWGIRHETAALQLEFTSAGVAPGVSTPFHSRVEEVLNARENVRNGTIQGIRSSDTLQGSISGRLMHLPTWDPYSDMVLLTFKMVFPIFPEPEIYFPAGTDMRLRTTSELAPPLPPADGLDTDSGSALDAAFEPETVAELDPAWFQHLPVRASTGHSGDADVINLVFLGTESEVRSAFTVAGWQTADPISRRSFVRNFYALLNNSGYASAPMRTFYLNGRPEDMNWQKGLNSYRRRDHLRLWRWATAPAASQPAQTAWVSSSTHDSGATLDVRYRKFVHHIDADIDEERSTVIGDLAFAGCVRSVSYVNRPELPTSSRNAIGDPVRTDGSLAVVTLQGCQTRASQASLQMQANSFRPGNHFFRFCRREILTVKSDLLRANIFYGAYDGGRMALNAFHRPAVAEGAAPSASLR